MIPLQIPSRRVRVYAALLAAFAVFACTSDPRSPLGSDNDLASSKPGVVFDDTLDIFADTTVAYFTPLARDSALELGRVSGYQRSLILQISWEDAAQDAGRIVKDASFRLKAFDDVDSLAARFYQLGEPYAEGDSVPSLDTLAVIVNPETGSSNRILSQSTRENPFPPSLVQQWIRSEIDRDAIAVFYPDVANDAIGTFKATEAARERPQLFVTFTDNAQRTYFVSHDATFVRPTTTTSNLVISDGYVRRIYFRMPLDQLAERSAIHNARVRLYIVPGSTLGSSPNLVVFLPKSDDPSSKDFLDGQLVTTVTYQPSSEYIEFTMTNAIALMLQGTFENNGVIVRYDAENSRVRQVQFYGSGAPDTLRPRLFITSSTPADFDPDQEP
ncbi:MAG TPA: hypothetical protein VFU38_09895 [Candidatus Krumholzibacteria bacterium]|nr:hypothetical protein [Candidatus Krumholzibacteria bacterium]